MQITKTPYEEIFRYHQFRRADGRGWLNDQETLSTVAVTVKDSAGVDQSSTMVSGAAVYQQTYAVYMLKAGTSGTAYTVNIRATTSNGQKFEDSLILAVL